MTVLCRQSLPVELPSLAVGSVGRDVAGRWAALATGVLGFLCVMPYPAIPVGGYTAIQMGNLFTVLMCVPLLRVAWQARPFWVYLMVLGPMCLAALQVAVIGGGDVGQCVRSIIVWGMSCLTIVVAQWYAPRYSLSLLTGIALATLVHAAVGVLQAYAFMSGEFPLLALYVNPSFLSVQDNAEIIARYIQRPFGIFPEPSAMSCSLAPWILFWFASLFGVIRMRVAPARWQRMLFAAAAFGGLGLIILSRSGHTMVTLAGVVLFAGIWLSRSRATVGTYLKIVVVAGAVLPMVFWLATAALSERATVENGSWQDRARSMVVGLELLAAGNWSTAAFGLGPGLSPPMIQRTTGLEAVWSVSLTYIYETGIVGALAAGAVGLLLLRVWHSLRYPVAFATIIGVWLVGITITTSYEQLLSLWLTLGWLTVWPKLCQTTASTATMTAAVDPVALSEEPRRRLT